MTAKSEDSARPTSFAKAVSLQFNDFRAANGNPEHLLVTIRSRDGQEINCYGMTVRELSDVGCVMFLSSKPPAETALILRDADVASATFEVFRPQPREEVTPFGFYPSRKR